MGRSRMHRINDHEPPIVIRTSRKHKYWISFPPQLCPFWYSRFVNSVSSCFLLTIIRKIRSFLNRESSKPAGQQNQGQPQQTQQAPMQGSGQPRPPSNPQQPHPPPQSPSQPQNAPQHPIIAQSSAPNVNVQANTLTIALVNRSQSSSVYATLTGRAIDQNNALFLLQSDGRTPYLPANPPSVGSRLSANVAIRLGAPGSSTNLTIPHIAGGRIYFSVNTPLSFFVNPGPALVEPSVTNPSDPNINIDWAFAEFTFNAQQLYANISYVDFVSSIPIALNLTTASNQPLTVAGLKPGGLDQVAGALQAQHASDGKPWDRLIVRSTQGRNLRVLSPNLGRVGNNSLFAGYFEPYVDQVYDSYANRDLRIDTQTGYGLLRARTAGNNLSYVTAAGKQTTNPFAKPSTGDIFSCSTGPFATGNNQEVNTIIPRLAAAFNRSTLFKTDQLPAPQSEYYQEAITNHYSRVVHEANQDGRGYAFPYDDVQPTGGRDASGAVFAGDARVWSVIIGGGPW